MGVLQLFDLLKKPPLSPLKDLDGKRAGIDVSILIWRAINSKKIVDVKGAVTQDIYNIVHCGVIPVLVFDGKEPLAKKAVGDHRRSLRLKQKPRSGGAFNGRTPKMEKGIQDWCKTNGVEFVMSPCEADAQLAYLMQTRFVDFVITQDSDLLVYGCEKVMYDLWEGEGRLYDRSWIEHCLCAKFDLTCIQAVGICVGGDYLKGGVPGFGIKKAKDFYQKLVEEPFDFQRMLKLLKEFNSVKIPPDFDKQFCEAANTFKYQLVYNIESKSIVLLTPYPIGKTHLDFPYAGIMKDAQGDYVKPPPVQRQPRSTGAMNVQHYHVCQDCQESFPTLARLKQHGKDKHPLICAQCGKLFERAYLLSEHVKCHGTRDMKCSFEGCSKVFHNQTELHNHWRKVHPSKTYVCAVCNRVFSRDDTLQTHMKFHEVDQKKWPCELCGAELSTEASKKAHMKSVHATKRLFVCETCSKSFKLAIHLKRHQSVHSNNKPFSCDLCLESFKHAGQLKRHQMTKHSGKRPYKCDECQKSFARNDTRKQHCRSCHKETSICTTLDLVGDAPKMKGKVCPVCSKVCSGPDSLSKHMLTHDDDYLKCSTCGKKFARADTLRKHQLTHTDAKPFKCEECSKCFSREDSLKRHFLSQHSEI